MYVVYYAKLKNTGNTRRRFLQERENSPKRNVGRQRGFQQTQSMDVNHTKFKMYLFSKLWTTTVTPKGEP